MTRVAVVGSGVAGLSTAYRLASDHNVVVLDRDAIGNGTSSRASGVITTPVDYPDQPAWSRHAIEFFRELDGTGVFEWTDREYVRGVRPADVEAARETATSNDDTGSSDAGDGVTDVQLVDADAYADVFDPEAPYEKALVWPGTGYFDVDEFLATMHHECVRRGVEFRPDTTVESVRVTDGAVAGIETEYGSVDADAVVAAAGSATPDLLADVLRVPIRPFTWNVAYLEVDLPDGVPMGGDSILGAYWRGTRDGRLLVGTEHQYGGSGRATAPPEDPREIGDELDRLLREDLPGILASVDADSTVVRYECCPMADATTPDAKPIIDAPAEAPDGLVIAAGFHGAGVMAADAIGTAVRARLTDEPVPFALEPLSLDRFETREIDFPFRTMFQGSVTGSAEE
ncbi:Glycine/D-amino acid oxidase [Halopenitus malekzadehii]|uniref:Glycine/D-amino acid oxidase n=1 Tax=Halopenitus malekzadehii TaxID=1267564 RepID=A0A1H6IJF2_9EURY|nr:FAD-binding oxidoreductase [Halopenitus malekzadehii]SEH48989.1 Glycine/D-amino acid oxidase [Halopenitus malekzadehii]